MRRVPLHPALKKFWPPWANPERMLEFPNRVQVGSSVFYAALRPYKIDGVRGKLALCLNQRRQHDARESRRSEIVYTQKLLAESKAIKPGLRSLFDAQTRLRPDQLAAEEFDGYSCIFCTRPVTPQPMLPLYFDKDLIEKAFRSLKGITLLRPVRHWLTSLPSLPHRSSDQKSRTHSEND